MVLLAQPHNAKHVQHRRVVANPPVANGQGNVPNANPLANPPAGNTGTTPGGNTGASNGATNGNSPAAGNNENGGTADNTNGNGNADQTANGDPGDNGNDGTNAGGTAPGGAGTGATAANPSGINTAATATNTQTASQAAAPSVVYVTTTSAASSTTSATSAVRPTTMAGVPTVAVNQYPSAVASRTYATNNWLSAASSATGTPGAASSGPGVGSIIGIVGGGLLGLVCVAACVGYFIRRAFRKKRERERFNRNKFVRNSVAVPGNDFNEKPQMGTKNALALARANNGFLDAPQGGPRPPSMVERRAQAAPTVGDVVVDDQQAGYYDMDGQYVYNNNYNGAYNDQYYGHQGQYGYDATAGYAAPADHQQQGRYDHDANGQGHGGNYDEYYNQDAGHQSVTPYQQEQYAEISRQLEAGAPTEDKRGAPQAGQGNASVSRQLSTTYSSLNPRQPSNTYSQPGQGDRSGTPTDRNPQQTYFPPTNSSASSPANKSATPGRYKSTPTRALHRSDD